MDDPRVMERIEKGDEACRKTVATEMEDLLESLVILAEGIRAEAWARLAPVQSVMDKAMAAGESAPQMPWPPLFDRVRSKAELIRNDLLSIREAVRQTEI